METANVKILTYQSFLSENYMFIKRTQKNSYTSVVLKYKYILDSRI